MKRFIFLMFLLFGLTAQAAPLNDETPNILVIVADDLGFTDLDVYGGEIGTPNINKLAESGLMFTNFYTSPVCSATRVNLLTGVNHHIGGVGNQGFLLRQNPNQFGRPGYEGYMNFRVATIAEILSDAGFNTYMTGKWHLGTTKETIPHARGFDRSLSMLLGGASHFDMSSLYGPENAKYSEDGDFLEELPEDFYSTRFFTDKLIEYIEEGREDQKPFFAYLSYTAVHYPLQAPEKSIQKYKGRYDEGYDALFRERLQRMAKLGLINETITPSAGRPGLPAWDSLSEEEKQYESRKMEIYAAMVSDIDHYVGKLIAYLKTIDEYENTIILFMSDNGAEGHILERDIPELFTWIKECCDNSLENIGNKGSYVATGPGWARASTGPFRMYKGFTSEGGIKAPAILHYPNLKTEKPRETRIFTDLDVFPTLLELVNVSHPGRHFNDRYIEPLQGRSIVDYLNDSGELPEVVHGWEM